MAWHMFMAVKDQLRSSCRDNPAERGGIDQTLAPGCWWLRAAGGGAAESDSSQRRSARRAGGRGPGAGRHQGGPWRIRAARRWQSTGRSAQTGPAGADTGKRRDAPSRLRPRRNSCRRPNAPTTPCSSPPRTLRDCPARPKYVRTARARAASAAAWTNSAGRARLIRSPVTAM